MTTHIALFIGAGPSFSTEFVKLEKSFSNMIALAPTPPKGQRGTTEKSIELAISAVWAKLKGFDKHDEYMKLSVWAFEPTNSGLLNDLWAKFGLAGWIELLPSELVSKDRLALQAIRERLALLPNLMASISTEVYAKRKTSPLPLPFRNFHSRYLEELSGIWYRGLDSHGLEAKLATISQKFRQMHTRSDGAHQDDRKLIFAPAKNTECHGKAHPTGSTNICFINGRFRFGSALYPGFHYDVSAANGNLACTLFDGDGLRDMKHENRRYINIYPNDVLRPTK